MIDVSDPRPDSDAIRLRYLLNEREWPVLGGYLPPSNPSAAADLHDLVGMYLWDQEGRELQYMPNPWCDVTPAVIDWVSNAGILFGEWPEAFEWEHLGGDLYAVPCRLRDYERGLQRA